MPNIKKVPKKKKRQSRKFTSMQKPDSIKCLCTSDSSTDSQNLFSPPSCKKKCCKARIKSGGIKKTQSYYRRLTNMSIRIPNMTEHKDQSSSKSVPYRSLFRTYGLSPKEKNFIICTCQTKTIRYKSLKTLAAEAISRNKIFSIYGRCDAVAVVRKALVERGWIEKLPPNRMNLQKIRNGTLSNKDKIRGELETLLLSSFVEKYPPNFIWRGTDDTRFTIDLNNEYATLVNKLTSDTLWTSKQGLCSSMKRNYWFYIEDVAEVNVPRSYDSSEDTETESFIKDYKITACTSLLKWVVSMAANERPVFRKSGKISINVVLFALNRCKEYLYNKQNKDIDLPVTSVTEEQWNTFIKKYYRIIGGDDIFQADQLNKLPLYLDYAKYLLQEMYRYRPQLSCEGCHNIWIIKPAHNSRGRGIRLASKLGVITELLNKANAKYVIQKYIEDPLLIHETKFDIRQYYLVTSTFPLVIWMYKDCYLKFSSQKYNLKNYHESIHLTNNAVQRKYRNWEGRHEELPSHNMWELDKFREYLMVLGRDQVWDHIIYPGMKKSIISTMLSCQDSLTMSKNRFELYGCDFILDKDYKPWLIEINSRPDLNHTTQVTAKICSSAVADVIKVVIDFPKDSSCSTGKFECIYRQPMTMPKYGMAAELWVRGWALRSDYFYRGNIEIVESYDNEVDIEKEKDIKHMMNKIQRIYDVETIMKEPEDDTGAFNRETYTCIDNTPSDFELNVAATAIMEQLDKLVVNVTSEAVLKKSLSNICNNEIQAALSTQSMSSDRYIKEISNIRLLLRKSLDKYGAMEMNELKGMGQKSFNFSELNDGLAGKASTDCINPFSNIFDSKIVFNHSDKPIDIILQATSKIVKFISKKEMEYYNEI